MIRLTIVFSLLLVLYGCKSNALRHVEELIAQNSYRDALKLFDDSVSFSNDALPLKALVQFVESQSVEGWVTLDKAMLSAVNDRAENAEICYRAATIIVREKQRYREVIQLLDSCIVMDLKLQDIAVEVAWTRGMEYLDVPTEAGYWLLKWASTFDKQIIKRLRGRRPQLAKRYIEMDETILQMSRIMTIIEKYYDEFGRYPNDLNQTINFRSSLNQVLYRDGWDFNLNNSDDEAIIMTATAKKKHPAGVLTGTVLKYHE